MSIFVMFSHGKRRLGLRLGMGLGLGWAERDTHLHIRNCIEGVLPSLKLAAPGMFPNAPYMRGCVESRWDAGV